MSSYVDEEIRQRPAGVDIGGALEGIISQEAASISGLVNVVLRQYVNLIQGQSSLPSLQQALAQGAPEFQNVRWQARDASTLPQRGDECLVVFSDFGAPVVVAWWPA